AFAVIKVEASPERILYDEKTGSRVEFNTYLRSQVSQLRSRFVLSAALNSEPVKKMSLDSQYADPLVWLEEELKIEFQPDSEFINIILSAGSQEEAQFIVNAITSAYIREIVDKERTKHTEAISKLDKASTEAGEELR